MSAAFIILGDIIFSSVHMTWFWVVKPIGTSIYRTYSLSREVDSLVHEEEEIPSVIEKIEEIIGKRRKKHREEYIFEILEPVTDTSGVLNRFIIIEKKELNVLCGNNNSSKKRTMNYNTAYDNTAYDNTAYEMVETNHALRKRQQNNKQITKITYQEFEEDDNVPVYL